MRPVPARPVPLDALDEKVAAYKDVAEFRTAILAGMCVQDLHIKMAETTSFTDLRYPEAIVGERQYGC